MTGKSPLTVEETAQILKISKYTVYELVKKGALPAQRVGRQLRFHPDTLSRYILGSSESQLGESTSPEAGSPLLLDKAAFQFAGSHDPCVELLIEFLTHCQTPLAIGTAYTGSLEGLIALYRGEADFAGIHLWDEQTEEYNLPFIRYVLPGEAVIAVNLVQRVQGWIVAPGNPLRLTEWEDITRKKLRFINRQKGSGTRLRLDAFLKKSGISPGSIEGYETTETTHLGVAYRVANGEADAGLGVQAVAEKLGLDFVPLFHERYDLVCLEATSRSTEWQQLMSILKSPGFQTAVSRQGGYDLTLTGKIMIGGTHNESE